MLARRKFHVVGLQRTGSKALEQHLLSLVKPSPDQATLNGSVHLGELLHDWSSNGAYRFPVDLHSRHTTPWGHPDGEVLYCQDTRFWELEQSTYYDLFETDECSLNYFKSSGPVRCPRPHYHNPDLVSWLNRQSAYLVKTQLAWLAQTPDNFFQEDVLYVGTTRNDYRNWVCSLYVSGVTSDFVGVGTAVPKDLSIPDYFLHMARSVWDKHQEHLKTCDVVVKLGCECMDLGFAPQVSHRERQTDYRQLILNYEKL